MDNRDIAAIAFDHPNKSRDSFPEKRILIVDDDVDFAESLVELLEPHNYTLVRAHNAAQAAEALKRFPADLALLDIRLGNDSGISLIHSLKKIKPDLICILITAYAEIDSAVGAMQEGAYDYLRKPLNALVLFATLDRCFERLHFEREQQLAQAAIAASETRYRELVETSQDLIFRCNVELRLTFVNSICREFFGCQPSALLGKTLTELQDPARAAQDLAAFQQVLAGKKLRAYETAFRGKDAQHIHVLINAIGIYDKKRQIVGIQGILHDITQRLAAEEQLKQSLAEKELLLKEVYHRVKNNLQLISSLLSLQANHAADRLPQVVFEECQSRIRAMALVHERLYQSKNLSRIELGEFTRSLANDLQRSLDIGRRPIRMQIDADPAYLGVDKAVPCGLILNELLSNSIKHAFQSERSGHIRVLVRDNGDGSITVTVADDGVGLPPHVDWQNSQSLGLKLVNALARQLKASLRLDNANGACFSLTFMSGHE